MTEVGLRMAELIAEKLQNGLVHPGHDDVPAKAINLPAFSTAGMPDEMARAVRTAARFLSEAIVALIEAEAVILDRDEAEQLHLAAAAAPDGVRTLAVRCRRCGTQLLGLTIGKTDEVAVDGKLVLTGLHTFDPVCPHSVMPSSPA